MQFSIFRSFLNISRKSSPRAEQQREMWSFMGLRWEMISSFCFASIAVGAGNLRWIWSAWTEARLTSSLSPHSCCVFRSAVTGTFRSKTSTYGVESIHCRFFIFSSFFPSRFRSHSIWMWLRRQPASEWVSEWDRERDESIKVETIRANEDSWAGDEPEIFAQIRSTHELC